jgi:flagellar biosynthesis protein FlhG
VAEFRGDQAAGLRRLLSRSQLRVVTFAAGSQRVGKSVSVANLASLLARQGREVLIVDENTDDPVAGFFGAVATNDLQQVIDGEMSLSDVLVPVAPGIRVLQAARVVGQLARLTESEKRILLSSLADIRPQVDIVLVDTSLDHPLDFSPFGLAAQETVIVVSPNGSVITEAYALIKKVSLGYQRKHFRILVNKVRTAGEALAIHGNIARVTRSRGIARLDFAGHVPVDERLVQASRLCQPVVAIFPESLAAQAYQALAKELMNWPANDEAAGGLEQFVKQLLHLSQRIDPVAIHA